MTSPDRIILAGTIHTLDPAHPAPLGAVAVSGGRIAAVGTQDDAASWAGPDTEIVDLGSATVVPGLVDGHAHPVFGLDITAGADLSGVQDLDEVRRRLAAEALRVGSGEWVQAWGLDPNAFGGAPVSAAAIDGVLGGRPAFVRLFDGHSALASSRALEIAGVDGPRSFDGAASVVCDADGSPTGLLLEFPACELVARHLPAETFEERRERLADVLDSFADAGLTGVHVMDHAEESAALYRALEERGELPVRLRCSPWCSPGTGAEDWSALAASIGTGGRRWEVAGIKLFIDGTIDNGTAWLHEPDTLGESTAAYWPDPVEYARAVAFFAERGVPTATHAIGDAGVGFVLDALLALDPGVRARAVHRIEHIETVPDAVVERFVGSGVVASMQPTHCTHYSRADHSDNWSVRLGPVRAQRAWRCRDLRDLGTTLALGSDWPIAPFPPLPIMADAQLRRRAGTREEPIAPGQALTARQALEGYTSHAARAAGTWANSGSITVGKRADLTFLELDPLTAEPDELAASAVLGTALDGEVRLREAVRA
ncbi:amidohydrolase [Sinomonas humi]|uniref:Amidohydrolase n=1 Tax=Sinomonas humi TaxID=1338436 RepID=A0A0B2ABT8_9MICC|nr:amidohydrolase [Sinomonas humi]KHL01050.1 amidohydrolase [Sinomonas humi]